MTFCTAYSMIHKNILFFEVLNLKGVEFLTFDIDTFVTPLQKLPFRVNTLRRPLGNYEAKREGHSSSLL